LIRTPVTRRTIAPGVCEIFIETNERNGREGSLVDARVHCLLDSAI